MSQLEPRHRALALDEPENPGQPFDVPIIPNTQIIGADPAFWHYGGGLGQDGSRATDRATA